MGRRGKGHSGPEEVNRLGPEGRNGSITKDFTKAAQRAAKDRSLNTWRTSSGELVSLRDMSDCHLVNVLRMLKHDRKKRQADRLDAIITFDPRSPYFASGHSLLEEIDRVLAFDWRDSWTIPPSSVDLELRPLLAEAAARGIEWETVDVETLSDKRRGRI